MLDRLTLSDKAIATMAEGLEQIVALPDPIGEISNMKYRPTGIQVGQMRVPLGVIGIIYEARPNVTVDAAGLCIKSGNATILRGGSEAIHCNQALAKLVERRPGRCRPAARCGADRRNHRSRRRRRNDHHAQYIDVIVPRGGKGLIERLMQESKVPMIKHLDGICHVYIDDQGRFAKGAGYRVQRQMPSLRHLQHNGNIAGGARHRTGRIAGTGETVCNGKSGTALRRRSARAAGRLSASGRRDRRRLEHRISGTHPFGQDRRRCG